MAGINDLVGARQQELVDSKTVGDTERATSRTSHTTRRAEQIRVAGLPEYNANHIIGGVEVFVPDIARPSVTINKKVGQADPAAASPVLFTIVFSEAVTGFVAADVDITGTAVTGAKTLTPAGDGINYELSVVVTADGTVIADIAENKAFDGNGNGNTVSTSTDNNVTVTGL